MYDFKQFAGCFNALAMHGSRFDAFNAFLDFSLLAFDYQRTPNAMDDVCGRLQLENARSILTDMFTEIGVLADNGGEGFADPLGEFFMMEITHGHNGQFFTPEPICSMMAEMQPEPKNGQRVADPACGSGRTLLAMAKRNRHLQFYGADIDHTCVKMTVINFLLNSLTGEVAHMDTIRNEFYCGYHIGTFLHEGFHYPYFNRFTDPEQSYIHLKLPKESPEARTAEFVKTASGRAEQGSLF